MKRFRLLGLGTTLVVVLAIAFARVGGMNTTAVAQTGSGTPRAAVALLPIAITVDGSGYRPSVIHTLAGARVRLVFTRTSDDGCGRQVVIPALSIRRDLPLNRPVAIDLRMPSSGRVAFTCGMNMYRGAVVVQ